MLDQRGLCSSNTTALQASTMPFCCCSRALAWGQACTKCPAVGTAEHKKLCIFGPGFDVTGQGIVEYLYFNFQLDSFHPTENFRVSLHCLVYTAIGVYVVHTMLLALFSFLAHNHHFMAHCVPMTFILVFGYKNRIWKIKNKSFSKEFFARFKNQDLKNFDIIFLC